MVKRVAEDKNRLRMASNRSRQAVSTPWWRGSSKRAGGCGPGSPSAIGPRGDAAAEATLVERARQGGPREREELVSRFMPMIGNVARAYRRTSAVDRQELIQEGVVGLLRALERYEPERGVPFWGYAGWWVRQAMQQVVSELSHPIVLSDRALRQLSRVKRAQRQFEQVRRREARPAELSRMVGLPLAQIQSLLRTERSARGLEEPAGADGGEGATVGELLADLDAQDAYDHVPRRVAAAEIPRLLERLSEREQRVIRSRYGLGGRVQTLREIAPSLGVSAERVRQIEQESLAKLHELAEQPEDPISGLNGGMDGLPSAA
jgi:RNA polymerase primary sigma factor